MIQGLLADLHTTTLPDGTKVIDFKPTMYFAGSMVLFASVFAVWLRMWMAKGKFFVNV